VCAFSKSVYFVTSLEQQDTNAVFKRPLEMLWVQNLFKIHYYVILFRCSFTNKCGIVSMLLWP